MKKCFKCLDVKPLSDFYKHKMMSDGHLNKYKACARADSLENRKNNIERCKEYDRSRSNDPKRVAARLAYQKTDAGIDASNKAKRSWGKGINSGEKHQTW